MKHLIFIGLMGSGKTTLGKKMAKNLGLKFMDTDEIIVAMEKQSISELFDTKGETYFRDLEKRVLEDLQKIKEPLVISTGGGLPCINSNMEVLNQMGCTVYLKLPPNMLAQRLINAKIKRPIIAGLNQEQVAEKLSLILVSREPIYLTAKYVLELNEHKVSVILNYYHQYLADLS